MKAHYKLTVESDNGEDLGYIGTFSSEKELAQWAKENEDTLSQYDEEAE